MTMDCLKCFNFRLHIAQPIEMGMFKQSGSVYHVVSVISHEFPLTAAA